MDTVVYAKVAALEKKINKVIMITHDEPAVSINTPLNVPVAMFTGTGKVILKTIFVEGPKGAAIDFEIASSSSVADRFIFYKNSIATEQLYDLVDIPYVDMDGADNLHLTMNNLGKVKGAYKVRISAILAN